jgi:hypothetical protein
MALRSLKRAIEEDVAEENLEITHELRACGGDCPRCQQERMEQRDEELFDPDGDDDYDEDGGQILWGGE